MTLSPLMTTADVADKLRITEASVRDLVERRGLPVVRIGRLMRYRPEELDAWLDTQRPESQQPQKVVYPAFVETGRG